MDWLDSLKVAIVSKNSQKIAELMDSMPQFDSLKKMEEAYFLLQQASSVLHELKDKTLLQMNQIKKSINFLESTVQSEKNSLDISS